MECAPLLASEVKRRPIRFDVFPSRQPSSLPLGEHRVLWAELQEVLTQFSRTYRPPAFTVEPMTGAYRLR